MYIENPITDQIYVGLRIQSARLARHITQESAAAAIGISVPHYRGIESGTRGMSIAVLVAISKLYKLSIDYIVLGKTGFPPDIAAAIDLTMQISELLEPYYDK